MQGRKLKEITAKAKGEEPKRRWGQESPNERGRRSDPPASGAF
jgi:hypothetical protein